MKKKEKSMRLTVNVNDYQQNELNRMCETFDVSTDTLLNRAIDLFILSGMGYNDVEQEKAFNDFKSHLVKIMGLYKASMVREDFKEKMMRQCTRKQIDSAFLLSQENCIIRDELSKLTEHKSHLEERVAAQADIIALIKEKIDFLERKN